MTRIDTTPPIRKLNAREKRYSFGIMELPDGTWGVMAVIDDVRDLGIDFHWRSKYLAIDALAFYKNYPLRHGHATEQEVRKGVAALVLLALVRGRQ